MKKYIYLFTATALAMLAAIILNRGYSKNDGEDSLKGHWAAQASARADSEQSDTRTSEKARGYPQSENVPAVLLIPVETDSIPKARAQQVPRIRSKNFTLPSGKRVLLKIEDDSWSIDVEPDPSGTRFLVNQASARNYSIYDLEGELIHKLPLVADALPELNPRTQFQWHWGHGEKMVATLGFIHEVLQNQYPESDTVAYDFRLYSYDLVTKRLVELKVPSFNNSDGLIRLDGISEEGFLILSQIPHGEDYWDTRPDRFLGVYKIPEY